MTTDYQSLALHLRQCVTEAHGNWANVNIDVLLDAAEYIERLAALADPETVGPTPTPDDFRKWWRETGSASPAPSPEMLLTANAWAEFWAARCLRAQPEPQGPTDEEIDALVICIQGLPVPDADDLALPSIDRGRDMVRKALARWGRPAIEPVAVQPEGRQDLTWIGVAEGLRCVLRDDSEDAIQRAWQRSRILDAVDLIEANCLPVPVAERPWEREGWCDAEGRCWWGRIEGNPGNPEWFLAGLSEIEGFYEIGD